MDTEQTEIATQLEEAPEEVKAAYMRMTPKQRLLSLELPKHRTIVDACIAAGYSKKAARGNCGTLAGHADVRLVADWLVSTVLKDGCLELDRLIKEIEHIAFSDARELFDEGGAVRNMRELPESVARAISSYEIDGRGKIKITFWDKNNAIEKGMKLRNGYPVPKKDDGPKEMIVGVVVVPQKAPTPSLPDRAIMGEATRIERTPPSAPKKTTFRVQREE